MKKNEFSELGSNLLGDRLILIVTGLMKEGGVMIDQVSNYVTWLIS